MMGTPGKALSETDGEPQGSSRKVGKVRLLARPHKQGGVSLTFTNILERLKVYLYVCT